MRPIRRDARELERCWHDVEDLDLLFYNVATRGASALMKRQVLRRRHACDERDVGQQIVNGTGPLLNKVVVAAEIAVV